ncbi:hypothetical protein HMN09_00778600 [Mycena chlorophos]|uniref:Uncharacterized protein n=1 Tax=Mycena chlorophos TaxID=658473 RepID=A0A8H6SV70_MYCCL|nr:hypothetical protein HMN09_00778600 [Mycena chlorophos]
MAEPTFIDMSADDPPTRIFIPEEWIGAGKKWEQAPTFVREHLASLLEPPPFMNAELPQANLPISEFIKIPVPTQSTSLNLHPAAAWLTRMLRERTIPPPELITTLENTLGSSWLDGRRGIVDPRYKGTVVLPLWWCSVWRQWSDVALAQKRVSPSSPGGVSGTLGTRGWCAEIRLDGTVYFAHELVNLLSHRMLGDNITERITSAHLAAQLLDIVETRKVLDKKNLPLAIRELEKWQTTRPAAKVWFTALVGNHEFVFCVDFGAKTLAYGDGIARLPSARRLIACCLFWLRKRYGRAFANLGKSTRLLMQYSATTFGRLSHGTYIVSAFFAMLSLKSPWRIAMTAANPWLSTRRQLSQFLPHPQFILDALSSQICSTQPIDIAQELFDMTYAELSSIQKAQVDNRQRSEHAWHNHHQAGQVRAVQCSGTAGVVDARGLARPCFACLDVLRSKRFKSVVNKPMPDAENMKHVNHAFRNVLVGAQYMNTRGLHELVNEETSENIFVRFAKGVLAGKYSDYNVFLGLVNAMVQRVEREERGKGMQNFQYTPAWDEFMHITRTVRSIRVKESRTPKLPLEIGPRTFSLLADRLKALNYHGPIALSCDDSKLQASLRLYWDAEKDSYFLVGSPRGPIPVDDPEHVRPILEDPANVPGTKVRLWMAQIPLPGMAPHVLAAIPISETMGVPALLELHHSIINGLIAADIHVVSYACDGTESERGVQRRFQDDAENKVEYRIPDPQGRKEYDLVLRVPVINGQPVVNLQDSKHALKTFRNNLFSGAPTDAWESCDSTLYHRDVERVDRQDDNAAARLFSASTLMQLTDRHSELRGLAIYLFVFGELVDAYQNRSISHSERLHIALVPATFSKCGSTSSTLPHCIPAFATASLGRPSTSPTFSSTDSFP